MIVFSAAIAVSLAQPAQVAPPVAHLAQNAAPATMVPPADAGAAPVSPAGAPADGTPAAITPATGTPAAPAPLVSAPVDDTTAAAPAAAAQSTSAPASSGAPAAAATDAGAPPATTEIVVSGERGLEKIDPVMGANKVTYAVMQKADDLVVAPAMHVYRDVLPKPLRTGLHNFFFNLTEPVNALNYMLQLHPGNALRTAARFGINTTIGIGGLMDVAKKKPFNLHYRPNGFANTLGYWGIGPGPYFFLPLVGPTTLRDLVGTLLGQAALPAFLGGPFNTRYYVIGAGIVTQLDYRVIVDDDLAKVRASGNPYTTYRQAYLKTRYEEIEALHGRGPLAKGEEGLAPFAKPLSDGTDTSAPLVTVPAPAPVVAAAPPAPVAPPPMVFVSNPLVQALPANYKPHHHHR